MLDFWALAFIYDNVVMKLVLKDFLFDMSCNFESLKPALNPGSRFIKFIVDANICSFLAANREQMRIYLSQLFLCGIQHDFLGIIWTCLFILFSW